MYSGLPVIQTEVFTRMPQELRDRSKRRPGSAPRYRSVDSFIEGPSFDRAGNLYIVDVPFGRIFRINPRGDWDLVVQYDGEPNGLKIHKDGRIFVADYKNGIMVLDPKGGTITPLIEYRHTERLRGVNDLVFASNGDLYFTDQGLSSLSDPTGRVYRYTAQGKLECLLYNAPSPNGIALSPKEDILYVAMTVAACVWRMQPAGDGSARVRLHMQMMCGGADGLAVDEEGNLVVVNVGVGLLWIADRRGMPVYRIESCGGDMTTNVAYGGPDRKTLYLTDSDNGQILVAKMPVPGLRLYSHAE
jgi:gluconolactonase